MAVQSIPAGGANQEAALAMMGAQVATKAADTMIDVRDVTVSFAGFKALDGLNFSMQQGELRFIIGPNGAGKTTLDRDLLGLIPVDSVFVLMSRAHVVDFDALTDLLYAGRFRAAIDVFPEEPVPADHPIRHAPNVVLSGHRAGSLKDELRTIGHLVTNDLEAMLAGLPPLEMQIAQPEIVRRLP